MNQTQHKLCHLRADKTAQCNPSLSLLIRIMHPNCPSLVRKLIIHSICLLSFSTDLNPQPRKDLVNFRSHSHIVLFYFSLEKRIHTVAFLLQNFIPAGDRIPSRSFWRRSEKWPYAGGCPWFVPVHCDCPGHSSVICWGVDDEKALVG